MVSFTEIDKHDLKDVCITGGSTHILKTCKIENEKFFLKFSDEDLFYDTDPSLQILVEYLAYNIYRLYPGVHVPKIIHLVFDSENKKVGLATKETIGKSGITVNANRLAKMMTAGMFVDIFIANWDVIGLGKDNVIIDVNGKLTRIDPGGSLTFRAQGGKKAGRFNSKANELSTMTNPNSGSGIILSKANAKQAAETFLSVSWEEIYTALTKVNNYILSNTNNENFQNLRNEWNKEYNHIASILHKRHKVITNHANFVLNEHIHTLENIIMENVKIILRSLL